MVVPDLPGPCHPGDGGRLQPARRRAARHLRPAAQAQMSAAMQAKEAIIDIRDLSLEFPTYRGRVHALSDVTLEVRKGEITGLVGESGSGKSVTSMSAIRL